MNSEESTTMVEVGENPHYRTWLCIDPDDRAYGWIFYKHPDGQYVSLRKATDNEVFSVLRSLPAVSTKGREATACEPKGARIFATPECAAFCESEARKNARYRASGESYEICPGICGAWLVIPATDQ